MSALFGPRAKAPVVTPIPTADNTEQRRIQAQAVAGMQQRSGRSSTLLSRNNATASSGGTTPYANTKMGQS